MDGGRRLLLDSKGAIVPLLLRVASGPTNQEQQLFGKGYRKIAMPCCMKRSDMRRVMQG